MSKLFHELLQMAGQQVYPQRMLLLFSKAEEVTPQEGEAELKGTISPVMCVDKLPEELTTFDDLVEEADSVNQNWDFILIASLSGSEHSIPTSDDAEPFLNKMVNDVTSGNDLSNYVIFDRQQNPIVMQVN